MATTIFFLTDQLAAFLVSRGGGWAARAAGLIGSLTFNSAALCSVDPPAQPTLTAADYQALLDINPLDQFITALGKLKDLCQIAIWYEMCQCVSPPQPFAPPTLWTPPANTTIPIYAGTNCPQPRIRATSTLVTNPIDTNSDNITARLFPGLPLYTGGAGLRWAAQQVVPIDPTWLSWRLRMDHVSGIAQPGDSHGAEFTTYAADLSVIGNTNVAADANQTNQHGTSPTGGGFETIQSTWKYLAVNAYKTNAASQDMVTDISIDLTCSGTGAPPPCCPPDPAISAMLQQLLDLANLQQRWRLPFASNPSTIHSVSGSTSFAVTRIVGLDILITSMPIGTPTSFGNPPYIFDLGWLSVSNADGMLQEVRLTRTTQVWFPQQCQLATLVGVALRPGVTAAVTELKVES